MDLLIVLLRHRLVPALLAAAGVALLGVGLVHYGGPAGAGGEVAVAAPSPLPTIDPRYVAPSLPPFDASQPPSAAPTPSAKRVATRIVIEQLGIDLPVIAQPNGNYPYCNVAMSLRHPGLGQPGGGASVYLYAHARDGMFGPLYERITLGRDGGAKSLIGMPVEVYTSDDQRFVYLISHVYPRVNADSHFLDKPLAVKSETLWLQTSTGHGGSLPKLQVTAVPLGVDAATHAAAHPKAHPIVCG
jgi:hypothetical protein